jgi:CelD/BcsL family acetyltransferase involved in cellulose biosynthesis
VPRPARVGRHDRPHAGAALQVGVVTDLAELETLEDAWHHLLLRSSGSTAFVSPAWVMTWYRHFERPDGIYVVAVRRGQELVGLAPFAQSGIGGRRAGFRLLVSAGTEHGDYGEPLLGPDPVPVAAAIADHLCGLVRAESVAVNLRRLYDDGPLLRALDQRDDVLCRPMGMVAHSALVRFDVLDDPEEYLDRLARRHSIPRRMRRLQERYGEVTFDSADPDLDGALDAMRDMLARRWGTGSGPRLFATSALEAFTRSVMRALVDAGLAHVSSLNAGRRRLAVSNLFHVGARHLSDNAAFEPELASYGLGQAELYHMLRHSLAAGAVEVDLRAGDFPYKRKWANAERVSRSLVLTAPGSGGEVALAARRLAMSLRARRLRRWERRPGPPAVG